MLTSSLCRCADAQSTVVDPAALHKGLDKAIAEFEADGKLGRSRGPYLIASRVYENVYECWALAVESNWKLCFVREEGEGFGSVWLYGDPSRIHEVISLYMHEVKEQIVIPLYNAGQTRRGSRSKNVLKGLGSTKFSLRAGDHIINKEPDVAWVPAETPNAFPSLVVEIAYKNESMPRLKQEMQWWSRNGVAITLGLKIDVKRMAGGIVFERFIFLLLDHEDGTEVFREINFSPSVCYEENADDFIQRIILKKLMRGFHSGLDPDYELEIDLYEIQQEIKELIKEERHAEEQRICLCRHDTNHGPLIICVSPACEVQVFHKDCQSLRRGR